ncbi:hypothetical protein B0H19DRAFT_1175054 [Mycena capillaripes]|nr:hypothetical protein B0H19DRAFT_1175054 [Mycena capillaripes]
MTSRPRPTPTKTQPETWRTTKMSAPVAAPGATSHPPLKTKMKIDLERGFVWRRVLTKLPRTWHPCKRLARVECFHIGRDSFFP